MLNTMLCMCVLPDTLLNFQSRVHILHSLTFRSATVPTVVNCLYICQAENLEVVILYMNCSIEIHKISKNTVKDVYNMFVYYEYD